MRTTVAILGTVIVSLLASSASAQTERTTGSIQEIRATTTGTVLVINATVHRFPSRYAATLAAAIAARTAWLNSEPEVFRVASRVRVPSRAANALQTGETVTVECHTQRSGNTRCHAIQRGDVLVYPPATPYVRPLNGPRP